MPADVKALEMERFVSGKTDIMVSTTVIEVGVNVPNASVMIIESAERFGLSQLHQLRGRVGRGADQSYCILMTGNKLSEDSRLRMKTMGETNDGFRIAEVDLKLRGPGDLQGTQQSGTPLNFKLTNLSTDGKLIELARSEAKRLLAEDPQLQKPVNTPLRQYLQSQTHKQVDWSKIA
jgi:ATP-dependent DNA helicase RecG